MATVFRIRYRKPAKKGGDLQRASRSANWRLLLAMADFGSHTSFFAAQLSSAFSSSFGSHAGLSRMNVSCIESPQVGEAVRTQ